MDQQNPNQQAPQTVNQNIEIDHDKLWGILAYVFFLIPLLAVKNRSSFLNYHINQGIILFIVVCAGNLGLGILPWWLAMFTLLKFVWNGLSVALLVIGIMNVLKREMKPLPVIGKLFNFLK